MTKSFLIQIDLKANLEDCPTVIPLIRRLLLRSAFDGKDGPKRLSYVKVEAGTTYGILRKYQPIADHPDVSILRVLSTCPNNASSSGVDDPITAKINEAWRKHRKRRQSQNVPKPNRLSVEDVERANSQAFMGRRRTGKSPTQPNKRELHAAAHNLFKPTLKGRA